MICYCDRPPKNHLTRLLFCNGLNGSRDTLPFPMTTSQLFPSHRWLAALIAVTLTAVSAFGASKRLWTAKLPGDAKWHSLTGLGTLVVGTDGAILAFDPENGQQLWKRDEFKKTSPFNAREVPGTPFLICNTTGGIGGLAKTTFFAVD